MTPSVRRLASSRGKEKSPSLVRRRGGKKASAPGDRGRQADGCPGKRGGEGTCCSHCSARGGGKKTSSSRGLQFDGWIEKKKKGRAVYSYTQQRKRRKERRSPTVDGPCLSARSRGRREKITRRFVLFDAAIEGGRNRKRSGTGPPPTLGERVRSSRVRATSLTERKGRGGGERGRFLLLVHGRSRGRGGGKS